MPDLLVRQFAGPQDYETIWRSMQAFTAQRSPDTPDEIWLLEHSSVYTQGQAGRPEHLIYPGHIPVVQSDRGGQITWHGPGQLMIYTLLDNRRLLLGARDLVSALEKIVITVLAGMRVIAYARPDAPGVYVTVDAREAKIASLGLRIRKAGCYHGLALNLDCDLAPFSGIHPCGFAGQAVTRLLDCVSPMPSREDIAGRVVSAITQELAYSCVRRVSLDE